MTETDQSPEPPVIIMDLEESAPPDIFRHDFFKNKDSDKKAESIFMASENGHMESIKGPFTPEQARKIIEEFRKRIRCAIVDLELDFIH